MTTHAKRGSNGIRKIKTHWSQKHFNAMMSEKNIRKLKVQLHKDCHCYRTTMSKCKNDSIGWKINQHLWMMTQAEIDIINKILKGK